MVLSLKLHTLNTNVTIVPLTSTSDSSHFSNFLYVPPLCVSPTQTHTHLHAHTQTYSGNSRGGRKNNKTHSQSILTTIKHNRGILHPWQHIAWRRTANTRSPSDKHTHTLPRHLMSQVCHQYSQKGHEQTVRNDHRQNLFTQKHTLKTLKY